MCKLHFMRTAIIHLGELWLLSFSQTRGAGSVICVWRGQESILLIALDYLGRWLDSITGIVYLIKLCFSFTPSPSNMPKLTWYLDGIQTKRLGWSYRSWSSAHNKDQIIKLFRCFNEFWWNTFINMIASHWLVQSNGVPDIISDLQSITMDCVKAL